MNVERLGRFGETIFHSADSSVRRSYRLKARILMQDLAFEPQSATHREAQKVFKGISAIARIRDKQDALNKDIRALARGVADLAAAVDVVRVGRLGGSDRLELSRAVEALSEAWRTLDQLLHAGGEQLDAQATALDGRFAAAAAHLDKVAGIDGPQRLRVRLDKARADAAQAVELYRRVLAHDAEAQALWTDITAKLEKLADSIATDAGLRAATMAEGIAEQAGRVRLVEHMLNGVLVSLLLLFAWIFKRHVLNPILAVTRSLDAVHAGNREVPGGPRALFSELDSIGKAVERYAGVLRELRASNEKLHSLSMRDSLTGLSNRRHFDVALAQEAQRAHRSGRELSLLMLDVDHFKRFNDTYGHMTGDTCLAMVADVLRGATRRAGELAARYGGEEFALILPDVSLSEARNIAERIRADIEALSVPCLTGKRTRVTLSIGVASLGKDADVKALVEAADAALYRAKEQGRNLVCADGE
jgi:diguanylate cyclase (GGDEF)-like protein